MGAAAPLRYYSGSDDGLGGTPCPPYRRGGVNRGCRPPQAISRQRTPPGEDTPPTQRVAPRLGGLSSPTGALRIATTARAAQPIPPAVGTALEGAVVPHTHSSRSDQGPGRAPCPPPPADGTAPMGVAVRCNRSPSSTTAWAGHRVPPAGVTEPMGHASVLRRSPFIPLHQSGTPCPPSRWDRANVGCRTPQALSRQRARAGHDTLSPKPMGPRQWGLLSPAGALKEATTAWAGHSVPPAGGAAPMGAAAPQGTLQLVGSA